MCKKFILRTVCILCVLMLAITGCTASKKDDSASDSIKTLTTDSDTDTSIVNPGGVFPIVKQPITIKLALVSNAKVEDYETNYTTKHLQEISGINLDIVELPSTDTITKVNLLFASDDLPDLFTGVEFSKSAVEDFVAAGKLIPIDDYIEKYGIGYKQFLSTMAKDAGESTMQLYDAHSRYADGKRYALDHVYTSLGAALDMSMCSVYEPWLIKLGVDRPTTIDDFYDLLVKFKNEDLNENGKADELPLTGKQNEASVFISYIGSAFQYTDRTFRLAVNDGIVDFIANNDLYKETLLLMNKMVVDGLVDPLLFTQETAELSARFALDDQTIGVIMSPWVSQFMDTSYDRSRNFVPLPVLKGPHGVITAPSQGPRFTPNFLITNKCKHPEAAYRIGDYMISDDGFKIFRYGEKGVQWDEPDPGATDSMGRPASIKVMIDPNGLTTHNLTWPKGHPWLLGKNYEMRQVDKPDKYDYETKKLEMAIMREPYVPKEFIPASLPFKNSDEAARVGELKELLDQVIMEYSVQFILGDMPFSMWDNYLNALEKTGVSEYVKLVQKNYDLIYK